MSDTQHAGQVISDLILSLVRAVHMVDKLIERLYNSCHINLVLRVHALSQLVRHVTIHILTRCNQILFDAGQGVVLLDLQVNNLVWNDSDSLQRQGLNTRPWEALNDPALALVFVIFDLFLDELDHNLIIN